MAFIDEQRKIFFVNFSKIDTVFNKSSFYVVESGFLWI